MMVKSCPSSQEVAMTTEEGPLNSQSVQEVVIPDKLLEQTWVQILVPVT